MFGTPAESTSPAALPSRPTLAQPAPAHSDGQLRILVVDDEDYVRDLLKDILEREGCEVWLAPDGREALRLFASREFDAVFTDVGLPGMSGWELARFIREKDEDVPLAVITGWGDTVGPEEQSAAKANWVIPKPFSVDRIAGLVHFLFSLARCPSRPARHRAHNRRRRGQWQKLAEHWKQSLSRSDFYGASHIRFERYVVSF